MSSCLGMAANDPSVALLWSSRGVTILHENRKQGALADRQRSTESMQGNIADQKGNLLETVNPDFMCHNSES